MGIKVGRPRKYDTAAARVNAFRKAHGLQKITLDVPSRFADRLRQYARLLRQFSAQSPISDDDASKIIMLPTRNIHASSSKFVLVETVSLDIEITNELSIIEQMANLEIISLRWVIRLKHQMELEWPPSNVKAIIRRGYRHEKGKWIWQLFNTATNKLQASGRDDNSLRRAKLVAEIALFAFSTSVYEANPTTD